MIDIQPYPYVSDYIQNNCNMIKIMGGTVAFSFTFLDTDSKPKVEEEGYARNRNSTQVVKFNH